MNDRDDKRVYAGMMIDSLKQKRDILKSVFEKTMDQESILGSEPINIDSFMNIVDAKGELIDELGMLDGGFDKLFDRLKSELMSGRDSYTTEISDMKLLISDITDLSTRIQVLEKRNDEKFKRYLSGEKSKVRAANKRQQTALTYVQSMSDTHRGTDSYFINETK